MWLALIRIRHERFGLILPIPMFLIWPVLLAASLLICLKPGHNHRVRRAAPLLVWNCMRHCAGTEVEVTSREGARVAIQLL